MDAPALPTTFMTDFIKVGTIANKSAWPLHSALPRLPSSYLVCLSCLDFTMFRSRGLFAATGQRTRLEEWGTGATKTIVIRNISTVDRTFHVPTPVQKHFTSAVCNGEKLPKRSYHSKAIAMFQRQDGGYLPLLHVRAGVRGRRVAQVVQRANGLHLLPGQRRVFSASYGGLDGAHSGLPRDHCVVPGLGAETRFRPRASVGCSGREATISSSGSSAAPTHAVQSQLIQWYRNMVASPRSVVSSPASPTFMTSTSRPRACPLVATPASKNPARAAAAAEKAAVRLKLR